MVNLKTCDDENVNARGIRCIYIIVCVIQDGLDQGLTYEIETKHNDHSYFNHIHFESIIVKSNPVLINIFLVVKFNDIRRIP